MKRPDEELADLSVAKLADIFHMERTTLAREFKLHIKVTLVYYLCREKMMRAAFLLANRFDIPVLQVAERLGFCGCRHFSRIFEKFFGTDPRNYREYQQIRSGVMGRREMAQQSLAFLPERYTNPEDRRKGVKDRRKNNIKSLPSVSVESIKPGFNIQGILRHLKENGTVEPRTNTDTHG